MRRISSVITGMALLATSFVGLSTPAQATPAVCVVGTGFAGGSGSTYNDPFLVSTSAQLAYLVSLNYANTDARFYKLTQSIDFQGCRIANAGGNFAGDFNGNGLTVSNYFVTHANQAGLFSTATDAVIANLTIRNATVSGGGAYKGALTGVSSDGTVLSNITVRDSKVTGLVYVGGLSGAIWAGAAKSISDLRVVDSQILAESSAGGIAGGLSGYGEISRIGAFSTTVERIGSSGVRFGGLFGILNNDLGNQTTLTMRDAGFRGIIDLGLGLSPLTALLIGDNADVTLTATDIYAMGTIEAGAGSQPSGLVGGAGTTNISKSYVRAKFVDASNGTTELAAHPFKSGPGTISIAYLDSTIHNNWVFIPAGVGRTTQEMKTATTYVNFAYTTGTSAVAAGSIADSGWYFSSAIDGGFMALTWEYWGSPIVPCSVGRYSFNGVGSCLDAPAGNFVATTGSFNYTPCPAGTFQANAGSSECQPAPAGTYVALPQQTAPIPCVAGTYQPSTGQTTCINASPGFFVSDPGASSEVACAAGTTSQAQATVCLQSQSSYSGPTITSTGITVRAGATVNLLGSELSSVTGVIVDGLAADIVSKSNTSITIRVPSVSAGLQDLVVLSGFGTLTVQGALRVVAGEGVTTQLATVSIKRIGNSVRLFVSEPAGVGKIQFKINGREIAWVRAVDATNPKLRTANGRSYFVRLAALGAGKNGVEIYVDGERVKRAAYTR